MRSFFRSFFRFRASSLSSSSDEPRFFRFSFLCFFSFFAFFSFFSFAFFSAFRAFLSERPANGSKTLLSEPSLDSSGLSRRSRWMSSWRRYSASSEAAADDCGSDAASLSTIGQTRGGRNS